MKHHQLVERSNQALQPVSPASYDSSLEVAPYNQAATPSSSVEFRGGRRAGEPHYNLKKTSTELLKVLNRIWSLEEQHSANVSVIKALKAELSHARVRIKELLRDQKADRHELDDLMKQLAEDKMLRKSKEHDRISSAVQTVREELEDERKLRKRSESLHRKLARELSEVKSTLSSCVKELEGEAKSRKMMERLCDEFAKGIKSYEREIHALNQKLGNEWEGRDERDRMVLHIAESWLDERMQTHGDGSVLEKLEFEIEAFLRDKQKTGSTENPNTLQRNRRSSLESVPLNSAPPQDGGDEEDSAGSDSNCFELKKSGNEVVKSPRDESEKPNQPSRDAESEEKPKRKSKSSSSLQVKFEEQMEWAMSCNGKKKTRAVDIEEEEEEGLEPENCEKNRSRNSSNKTEEIDRPNSNSVIGEMIRKHQRLLSGSHENDEASCSYPSQRQASPVRQWTSRTITPDLVDFSVTEKATQVAKDNNTLKAKPAEVRSKSSRPRLRLFKG
ncbi:PREDICTED: uncharacterized protein At5g41620 isoform X2 [Tarenaya hassleriana]|nr:PREDICTED: uncharacterized protein At5g41620 isoform X2 [Tarenaya hassleriana]